MLVALPAAIAFGVTIYPAIGPSHAALGALAGIIGATVVGLIASVLGGTDRLISAPCAPAAAVLSAFAIELVRDGMPAGNIVLMLLMLGILAGLFQVLFGFVGIGRLIKYIPYQVVSGYLTGVGLIIIGSQITKLVGAASGTPWHQSLISPWMWDWRSVAVGGATIGLILVGPSITRKVPGTILGISAGLATYFCLATQDASLLNVSNNPLVIGPLGASSDGYFAAITSRWHEIGDLRLSQVAALMGSALTLAVLLSIDTLTAPPSTRRRTSRLNRSLPVLRMRFAAKLLEGKDAESIADDVMNHLETAEEALRETWGQTEFTRLSQNASRLADFGPAARIAFGEERLNDAVSSLSESEAGVLSSAIGKYVLNEVHRQLLLGAFSELWVEYLTKVEALRVSIGLEAYAQRDPLVQYKGRASEMFAQLLEEVCGLVIGRCGWFDAVVARYSARVNGFDGIVLTKLDVLDTLEEIPICVGYRYRNTRLDDIPVDVTIYEECKPIYENMKGWNTPTGDVREWRDLPQEARDYIKKMANSWGSRCRSCPWVPIAMPP